MNTNRSPVTLIFLILVVITLLYWLLRGFGIITFLPGYILWLLILLAIAMGILSRLIRV